MPEKLILKKPDDWHLHLRDGAALQTLVPCSSRYCGRVVVMPNLLPPIKDLAAARAYRSRVLAAAPANGNFKPLMTLYLTADMQTDVVRAARASGEIAGIKLYPAGATTNSAAGVADISALDPVFETMAEVGLPLLIHGEVTDPDVDIFDREARFIDEVLVPMLERIEGLRVVLEHISTRHAVQFVLSRNHDLAATVTPQHLYMNRNAMLAGGIRTHNYCLPVLKRERDRRALITAATSGDARFFMGTDSAPHARGAKESACGCAGVFNAPVALSVYAAVFEEAGALDKLEAFTSLNGPRFYGLETNRENLILSRNPWQVPDTIGQGTDMFIPWLAGETLNWQVLEA